MPRALISLFAALSLTACASTGPDEIAGNSCQSETLTIDAEFERGAFAGCKLTGKYSAKITIRPEPRTTNNSAWYAYRIKTDAPALVSVTMNYKDGSHRYWPKASVDGMNWTRIPQQDIRVSESREKAKISLQAGHAPLFVAAQPLDTFEGAVSRVGAMLEPAGFTARVAGQSIEGVPIVTYENMPADATRLVVLLARQHPPETTGSVAFEAFVERLASEDEAASHFRRKTKIFIAPMVNPDGFINGHWRGNAEGYDLNRDWGTFHTPEVKALGERILELSAQHDPVFFADFHSTQRTVIYAAPLDIIEGDKTDLFLEKFTARLGGKAPEISRSHKSANTTAKAWSLETLGVAGFTYEVADDADLDEVAAAAAIAAEVLMEIMAEQGEAR